MNDFPRLCDLSFLKYLLYVRFDDRPKNGQFLTLPGKGLFSELRSVETPQGG